MLRLIFAVLLGGLITLPALAQTPNNMQRLVAALELQEIVEVMRQEGMAYGAELADDMFPGRGDGGWKDTLGEIFDEARMYDVAMRGIGRSLNAVDVDKISGFLESPLGREITMLEISARRALLDKEVEEANKATVADMIDQNHPRIAAIHTFIEANNLLESNVVGAMNSNFAFYSGLVDGGAYSEPMSEDQILKEVWGQESEIRVDTTAWLTEFLTMAYSALSDDELQNYIEFSRTPEGQALNSALFAGFDEMFEGISRSLGMAAARIISSDEL